MVDGISASSQLTCMVGDILGLGDRTVNVPFLTLHITHKRTVYFKCI